MGYTLSLWAAPVDELERLLDGPGGDRIATPEQTGAVAAWLTGTGSRIDAVTHSSSGGDWFRDDVIAGPVAARFGDELAENLLGRPLSGVDWDEYPSIGWVRNAELAAAVAGEARDTASEPDSDEDEVLQTITDALVRVLDSGQDLVTYYG